MDRDKQIAAALNLWQVLGYLHGCVEGTGSVCRDCKHQGTEVAEAALQRRARDGHPSRIR